MNQDLIKKFQKRWEKYFPNTELPIVFWYDDNNGAIPKAKVSSGRSCLICELNKIREGHAVAYDKESIKCPGAQRYTGYSKKLFPEFRYFLSCGIPATMEGERYKRSPRIVDALMKQYDQIDAHGKYLIFKRWDQLEESDQPEVVIFFATADMLSGLFTLANFDQADPNGGVMTPFAAGCGSIIHFPYLERKKDNPKAVIGMFDVSARPCVSENILTFALPIKRFEQLVDYMDESFLITDSWKKVMKRF